VLELEKKILTFESEQASRVNEEKIADSEEETSSGESIASTGSTEKSFLFRDLPRGYHMVSPGPEPSIELSKLRISWVGRTLTVLGDILYVKKDTGNQQGRIVVLARGPNTLLTWPNGVLGLESGGALINPQRGEYYSVSRYRELKATFRSVISRSELEEVQVLIFGQGKDILISKKLAISKENTPPEPVAPEIQEPATKIAPPPKAVTSPATPSASTPESNRPAGPSPVGTVIKPEKGSP